MLHDQYAGFHRLGKYVSWLGRRRFITVSSVKFFLGSCSSRLGEPQQQLCTLNNMQLQCAQHAYTYRAAARLAVSLKIYVCCCDKAALNLNSLQLKLPMIFLNKKPMI